MKDFLRVVQYFLCYIRELRISQWIHQVSPYFGSRIYPIQRIYIHSVKFKKYLFLVYGYGFHTGVVSNSPDWVYFFTVNQ
jgi:hypothetical protein